LIFDVSEAQYVIGGVTYTSPEVQLTLSAADGSNPRIDVIKVSTSSVASVTEGTPAADPAKPEVDPLTELELTFITVNALATDPDGVITQDYYLEDAGDPTEWDATENTAAARITLASVADPWLGTKSILYDGATVGDTVTLTAGADNDLIPGAMETLELHVNPATWAKKNEIRIAFFNGANRISDWVSVKDKVYGFDRNDANYQTIGIPASDFQFTDVIADSMQLDVSGSGGALTAQVDQIRAQSGITMVNIFIGLTEEELINNERTFNATQDFTTVEYGGEAVVLSDLNVIKLGYIGQNLQTGTTYELVLGDAGKMLDFDNGSAIAVTIPANASVPFPVNTRIDLNQGGAGLVTVGITSDTLNFGTGAVSQGQDFGMSLWKKSATVWVIYGGTTA
jgi:hypothetical protein